MLIKKSKLKGQIQLFLSCITMIACKKQARNLESRKYSSRRPKMCAWRIFERSSVYWALKAARDFRD